jgi:hypothetical protein
MWKPWALVRVGKSSTDVKLAQVVDLSLHRWGEFKVMGCIHIDSGYTSTVQRRDVLNDNSNVAG